MVAEDGDGTGFGCDEYHELHIGADGLPLNSGDELLLEGELRVGYVRIMELRKLNGKRRQLRESIVANDASLASAVVLPLVKLPGNVWVTDCSKARPVLVPVLSLGRRMVANEMAATSNAACGLKLTAAAVPAGGPQLQRATLSSAMFAAAAMIEVSKDLMKMKVTELKLELAAREKLTTGPKPWLRRRLHAAIVYARG